MSGLDRLKKRLDYYGGSTDGRIVQSKLRSFHLALQRSYQTEDITLDRDSENPRPNVRCLINPSRLTEEFDKKVISIDFDYGLKEGDVFYWDRTNQYWIVIMQQHTEEAYFRGIIKRCKYQIEIDGETYWVSLTGPSETSLKWNLKHGILYNSLNYSMSVQIPKNKKTMYYCDRFKVLKMKNTYMDEDTNEELTEWHYWRIAATDKYSSDGVIDVYLEEYPDNFTEELMLQPEFPEPEPEMPYIAGPRMVYPFDTNLKYEIKNASCGRWLVNSDKVKISEITESSCVLEITSGKSMKFDLIYKIDDETQVVQTILVEAL